MATQISECPLHLGPAEQFAQVRGVLKAAAYNEETFFKILKIEQMSDVGNINFNSIDFSDAPAQFQLFCRLFFGQRSLPLRDVEAALEADQLNAFFLLGLLGTSRTDRDVVYARVLLYPVAGFLIASDRHTNPDGSAFIAPADIVFPAIYGGTLLFLKVLPKTRADQALDLGSGTGIGAFVLSRCNKLAVASDLTQRATDFATFNRALNDVTNVEVVRGDLYSAVKGRTFDRIVAHPPYVPSLDNTAIWRDGGVTGEALARRIIERLPEYLRPGGTACIVTLGLDTQEGAFEERARQWLKDAADEFDIIFAYTNERTPDEVLRDLRERNAYCDLVEQLSGLQKAFTEAGIVRMPHGAIVLRRCLEPSNRQPWTFRVKLSEVTEGADFESASQLHEYFLKEGSVRQLAEARLTLAPRLEVKATHVVYEGSLVPAEFIFETDKPFAARGRVDKWMIPLFTELDGKSTLAEIYERRRLAGDLPDGFLLDDLTSLVARMVERGFLRVPTDFTDYTNGQLLMTKA
ncbi:MAG: methyltransferase [Pyrinomonadaceae bacterium]